MMNWPQLLSLEHLGEDYPWKHEPERSSWQTDYDRIVFSYPFRRLQDKTQVHPLSGSDYVRTRLTHSLEVSSVARTLGAKAGKGILERHGDLIYNDQGSLREVLTSSDIGAITAAAALAHDIGNPPFGHSGEDSIRHWFLNSGIARRVAQMLTPEQRKDFEIWEGNAAGFRILARNENNKNRGGMRLTTSTLATFMKYPTSSNAVGSEDEVKRDPAVKKPGFFLDDENLWKMVAKSVGLISTGEGRWCRHPLVYLTEAADDICYRLIDIEDGHRLGLVPFDTIKKTCGPLIRRYERENPQKKDRSDDFETDREKVSYLHAICISGCMNAALESFKLLEPDLLNGKPIKGLLLDEEVKESLESMEIVTKERIYSAKNVLEIETAGFEIIAGLLDAFVGAVEDAIHAKAAEKANKRADKLLRLLPRNLFLELPPIAVPAYERTLRIVDFIAGMTDSYALDLFRKIKGVTIPR